MVHSYSSGVFPRSTKKGKAFTENADIVESRSMMIGRRGIDTVTILQTARDTEYWWGRTVI